MHPLIHIYINSILNSSLVHKITHMITWLTFILQKVMLLLSVNDFQVITL
jgi:hypothetical protein